MTAWVIEALVASSALMLLVLALRGPVARRFGAQAAYLLWALPVLRLMLPRMPEPVRVPMAAVPVHIDLSALMATAGAAPDAAPAPPVEAVVAPFSWSATLLVLWLAGAAVYMAWQVGRYHRFMALALDFAGFAHRKGGVSIRLSSTVSGPIATGLFRRTILLPLDYLDRYDRAERRLVLAHEMAHHRRGDIIANAVALVVVSLHWFNPLAHWAYRAFRADQELACDATVLGRAGGHTRPAYGSALLKSAVPTLGAGQEPAVACGLGASAGLLKQRMQLLAMPFSATRRVIGSGLAVLTVLAGLGLTASGSIAAPAKAVVIVRQPLVALAAYSPPAARAPLLRLASLDLSAPEAAPAPRPPVAPAAPEAPLAPSAAPVPPAPPVPPVPPAAYAYDADAGEADREAAEQAREAARDAAEQAREALREAERQARDNAREVERQARETARQAADQAREAGRQAAQQAREAARASAAARVDAQAIVREVHAQLRAELGKNCPHARAAPKGETDEQAIARLTAGCVDRVAIRRQVRDGLHQARVAVAKADLGAATLASVNSALDQAMAELDEALR